MNSRALRYPIIISAAIHAAALSGILSANAGLSTLGLGAPVVFISFESQGKAGEFVASGTSVNSGFSATPGERRVAQPQERSKLALAKQQPVSRSFPQPDHDPASLEPALIEPMPTVETGRESGQEESRQEMYGDVKENNTESGAYALQADSEDLSENRNSGETGSVGNGARGTSSASAIADLPKPVYPRYSRIRGEEGTVVLEAEVTADGKPLRTRVVRSSGYRHLDAAALEALNKASFIPARSFGVPVESTRRVSVRFSIREE